MELLWVEGQGRRPWAGTKAGSFQKVAQERTRQESAWWAGTGESVTRRGPGAFCRCEALGLFCRGIEGEEQRRKITHLVRNLEWSDSRDREEKGGGQRLGEDNGSWCLNG